MSENQVITNMENEVEEMTAIHYLNQDNAVFERTEGGFLSLSYEGKKWDRIQVIRLFPFTEPDSFLSIRTVEERSHEIGVIKNIKEVDKKTRKMLLKTIFAFVKSAKNNFSDITGGQKSIEITT